MKIEIKSTEITSRQITTQRGPMQIREQIGYWHKPGEAYPLKMIINLDNTQPPYPAGVYSIGEDSFFLDRYSKLSIGRLALQPVASPARQAS